MISLTSSLNDLRDEVKFKYVIRYKDNELSQFNLVCWGMSGCAQSDARYWVNFISRMGWDMKLVFYIG